MELDAVKLNSYDDRSAKIAAYKMKKQVEQQLDALRNYQDEEMKREFYMAQINQSILTTFEQLNLMKQEIEILKHMATLTPEQIKQD